MTYDDLQRAHVADMMLRGVLSSMENIKNKAKLAALNEQKEDLIAELYRCGVQYPVENETERLSELIRSAKLFNLLG